MLRELTNFAYSSGDAWIFDPGTGRYFVVLEGTGPGNQPEALVFNADETGQVLNWTEIIRHRTRDQALDELENRLGPWR
jgi:hypothetical protein